jgi:desulfoferrodoxin (superoxide reductase-like protein)
MQPALKSLLKAFMGGITVAALFLCAPVDPAFADKSSVAISAPESAAPGSEITIQVTVTHSANNFIHYTDWLTVTADGKEIARRNYTWNNKPEDKVFTKEIKYSVMDSVEITAEAHCNMHGSKGPQTVTVVVPNTTN